MDEGTKALTFWDHLDVLRSSLIRMAVAVMVLGVAAFCLKDMLFSVVLAPRSSDFVTYQLLGVDAFHINLMNTGLTEQFMIHMRTAIYAGLLLASPYILYELFRFISPALYETERKYSVQVAGIIYVLFLLGVLMSYFVLFPISFRFLGTYSVSAKVVSNITLDSYISTFVSLTLVMGVVFQLPVIAFFLGKMGVVTSSMLANYRKHSLIVIMLVAAIITPPDLMTLILVTIPLYLLYEVSIRVVKWVE